jgi:cytochrome c-type biogenesis protein CcmH/NrfF
MDIPTQYCADPGGGVEKRRSQARDISCAYKRMDKYESTHQSGAIHDGLRLTAPTQMHMRKTLESSLRCLICPRASLTVSAHEY